MLVNWNPWGSGEGSDSRVVAIDVAAAETHPNEPTPLFYIHTVLGCSLFYYFFRFYIYSDGVSSK